MRNLNNPKWLFIVNTLPIVILFVLFIGQFNIIKTLLNKESLQYWKIFGLTLGILGLLNFAYAVFLVIKKKSVSIIYSIAALPCYIAFIYLYFININELFTAVPQWMMMSNVYIYVGAFFMPTLAYSLFIFVLHFTALNVKHKTCLNFLIAISIPLVGFIFVKYILPLWNYKIEHAIFASKLSIHSTTVFFILVTLVFFFFLIRGIYIIVFKKAAIWQEHQLKWKIPAVIVLPLLGLLVNAGFFPEGFQTYPGAFGNFSSPWFFIIAALNGVLICLPNLDKKIYRSLLFIGRSATLSYSLYFFLVFLPFLPFSIIFILALGAGFLMLAPVALFIIHITEIAKDIKYLKKFFSKKIIITAAVLCFLTIPACITAIYLNDKFVLNRTLEYLYAPDYSKQYSMNKRSIQRTLNVVKNNKNPDPFDFLVSGKIPYLSSYFNWLVLNNLTLSDEKISYAQRVFLGETMLRNGADNFQNERNTEITKISTESVFDESQNAWKSTVNLEITNKSNRSLQEYSTVFSLPQGCWISDYYLYVGEKKEEGILAEKKSAMWVYYSISRVSNRDPGILFYLNGNKVSFQVYPFSKNETRRTGIEFLHKEPVVLHFDKTIVNLGNEGRSDDKIIETENFVYIPAAQKRNLKQVQRKQYLHFLVDVSKNKEGYADDFSNRIEKVLTHNETLRKDAQISFVNSYVNTFPLDDNWRERYKQQKFEGGFFLERAIQTALYRAYKNNAYPVIVVVSDDILSAVLDNNFFDFKFTFPESYLFFRANLDGTLAVHSLINNPKESMDDGVPQAMTAYTLPVLEYKLSDGSMVYLALYSNLESEIALKKDIFKIEETDIKEKNWQSALVLQAKRMSNTLHPEISNKEWKSMVKYSFKSKVMTPLTSYIVVENEAQKAALKKKQEQVLSGGKLLDTDEESQSMSEPGIWILAILFGLAMFIRRASKSKLERKEYAKTL